MTWQHVLRVVMVAFVGAIALALASQARAEGGEGASVVAPEAALSATEQTSVADATEQSVADQVAVDERAADEKAAEPAAGKAATKQSSAGSKVKKSEERIAAASKGEPSSSGQKPATVVKTNASTVSVAMGSVAAVPAKKAEAKNEPKSVQTVAAAQGKGSDEIEAIDEAAEVLPKNARARAEAQRTQALKPLVQRYALENKLPFELADAVIRIESRYNTAARNGPNIGLTQINATTARSLGYEGGANGLNDAETNLRYGLKYLAMAYRLAGGDTCGTILRYQFGHRTVTMTKASQKYCARVKTIIASAN